MSGDKLSALTTVGPCTCGIVAAYGGLPWGVSHSDGCAAVPGLDRLTKAIMAAVGSPHPDDFGIAYRDRRGFSPAGLAAAILARLPDPEP